MDLERRNNALLVNGNTVNGETADIAITTHGSDWYFAVCAVMTVAAFSFVGLSFRRPRRDRLFHYITAGVVFVAAIAYFTMGANLGFTPILVEYQRSNPKVSGRFREIFYVRYIDWFITTPLLLTDLMLTAGMPWPTIAFVILVDEIMIITGLIGALVTSIYKWGYFAFGCFALVYITYHLVWESRRNAARLGKDVNRAFLMCGSLTAFLWMLYPIAWGLCEGGNVISGDSEAVFYGILDLLAKPVFGALLIWNHRNISMSQLGLNIHDYDDDHMVVEKRHGSSVPANGHSNGAGGVTEAHLGANDGVANGQSSGPTHIPTTTV